MCTVIPSVKQRVSVAPQNGTRSNQNFKNICIFNLQIIGRFTLHIFNTNEQRNFFQLLNTINYQGGELLPNFKINAKTCIT